MDFLGTTVFLGALCCLILALQWGGQTLPWSSSKVIGLLVGFGILTIMFSYIQWKLGDKAIIPLRILRQRSMLAGSCFLFFFGMVNLVVSPTSHRLDQLRALIPMIVLILFAILLSSRPRCISDRQRRTDNRSCSSSDRHNHSDWGCCFAMGLLCKRIQSRFHISVSVTTLFHCMQPAYWTQQVPYMIVGQTISVVGAGLITRLDGATTTVVWASYLVITGIGMGMAMQLPYTALQVVLR
jgi:hypothetical protein